MTPPQVQRFTARTPRDALALVRDALGDDAVVLSTEPCGEGVEVLAMPPEAPSASSLSASSFMPSSFSPSSAAAAASSSVEGDVATLQMSTLSFQDYVRNRMLKRRNAERAAAAGTTPAVASTQGSHLDLRVDDEGASLSDLLAASPSPSPAGKAPLAAGERQHPLEQRMADGSAAAREPAKARAGKAREATSRDATALAAADAAFDRVAPRHDTRHEAQPDVLAELRAMRGLIEERFGALAFMEKLQRRPEQARLAQKLLGCGFSPALVRKLADGLGTEISDESAWAAQVLERNLQASESATPIEDRGGVHALIGATGVGKTTTTAKIAAAFATRHGASNLGLITLDAYRVGAHEQLRAYGRILGVPVHTAHDRASLEDLLDLLSAKKMVLIDTAGMAQRDTRTQELLEMLGHRSIQRLLVLNAASQGETIEDVLIAYRAGACAGVVLSKIDEAVKLGPALDAAIRHKLKIVGVGNGQRVPEDWHRLSAHALVQRALRGGGSAVFRLEADEVSLVFAAPRGEPARAVASA